MRIFLRVVFVLVVVAALAGVGVAVFDAGVAQGIAVSGQLPKPDGTAPAVPYYAPFYRPWGWGFGGFGCFALLGLLLLFPLIFGLARWIFGPRYGGWRGGWRGFDREHIPPTVEEWHRKMHESQSGEKRSI